MTVRSHLRMNGRWRVERGARRARPGLPWLVLRTADWEATQWNGPVLAARRSSRTRRLGPDLARRRDERSSRSSARIRASDPRRLVGDVLVDQRVVAGIGNMWLAELLWHAADLAVAPGREDDGRGARSTALAWGREAMRRSVGGERPAPCRLPPGGRPCPRCGAPIRSRGLGEHEPHRVLVRGLPARVA